jgi:hypothetical protein
MFAPDPAGAARELARVAAPGARLGVLVWGAFERNPWMATVGMAGAMSGILTGGPPVGPGGPFSLSDPALLRSILEGAGWQGVEIDECPTTFSAPTIDEHVAMVTSLAGPMAEAFRNATPDQRAQFTTLVTQLFEPHLTETGLHAPGLALLATAHR